jgi:MFS family permease
MRNRTTKPEPDTEQPRTSDWRIALWLGTVAAGGNVPVPLLLLYRERLALSPAVVTALFGVYALGMLPALAIAGPAVDRWGERRVAVPTSLAVILVSSLFGIASGSLPLLFAARVLQGFVGGVAFTVGTAWLSKTHSQRPGSGGRTAAVAMTAGFSLGSLAGGLLGQWGPAPTTLPYFIHALAVFICLLGIRSLPGTRPERLVGWLASAQVLRAGAVREALLVVAPSAINAVPLLVGVPGPAIVGTGLLAAVTLGSGAAAATLQRVLGRWSAATAAGSGALAFALITTGAAVPALRVLVLPAAALLGVGGGLSLAAGLVRLPRLAQPGRTGLVSAGFYAFAYVGFGVPFLLAEIRGATGIVGPFAVLLVLATALSFQQAQSAQM